MELDTAGTVSAVDRHAMVFMVVGTALAFCGMYLAEQWRLSTSQGIGMAVVLVAVLVACLVLWSRAEARVRRWRGRPERFSKFAQLDVGEQGISIEGLGLLSWSGLHHGSLADSTGYVVLYTPQYTLCLTVNEWQLVPILDHYLALQNPPLPPEA